MESSLAIANYFIDKAQSEQLTLSPMKLVKLVYVAHGWYLGITGKPLFSEDVQAWKYGPVIPSIYNEFKKYGSSNITQKGTETIFISFTDDLNITTKETIPTLEDESKKKVIDKVWDVYKKYDGIQLSAMTHKENTPWDIAYNKMGGKDQFGFPIPNQLIKTYYQQKANAAKPRVQ